MSEWGVLEAIYCQDEVTGVGYANSSIRPRSIFIFDREFPKKCYSKPL